MEFKTKLDHTWFGVYVETLLEHLNKGDIDEEYFVESIKSKHEELKNDDFSKVVTTEY